MTDTDPGPGGDEFWCGMASHPADDNVATEEDVDRSRTLKDLLSPRWWLQAVIRKVRTVGGRR